MHPCAFTSFLLLSDIPEYANGEGVYINSSSKLEEVALRAKQVKTEEYVYKQADVNKIAVYI